MVVERWIPHSETWATILLLLFLGWAYTQKMLQIVMLVKIQLSCNAVEPDCLPVLFSILVQYNSTPAPPPPPELQLWMYAFIRNQDTGHPSSLPIPLPRAILHIHSCSLKCYSRYFCSCPKSPRPFCKSSPKFLHISRDFCYLQVHCSLSLLDP